MGFALPNGAHVYLASGYGSPITFTGATNAENAVITVSAAGDLAVGDIVHVSSNWTGIDNVIAKIDAIAGTAVTLRNINTSNKNKFAAGGGSGSVRKVKEWTELPQITEVAKSGGDQNTVQIQFLSDDRQRNLNTFKTAVSQTYTIAHDSTLPVYPLLRQLDENGDTVAAYMYVPKAKENRYWSATVSFDDVPTSAPNAVETVSTVLNLQSPAMTFYKVEEEDSDDTGGGSGDGTGNVAVTGVSLGKSTLSIAAGASDSLSATVTPDDATNKAVTWSSSDDSIVTVDSSGQVTGVTKGDAIITVTTADSAKTATCDVTVTATS